MPPSTLSGTRSTTTGDCWPSFPPGATSGRRSTGELRPPAGVTKQLIPQDPEHRSRVTREEPDPFETPLLCRFPFTSNTQTGRVPQGCLYRIRWFATIVVAPPFGPHAGTTCGGRPGCKQAMAPAAVCSKYRGNPLFFEQTHPQVPSSGLCKHDAKTPEGELQQDLAGRPEVRHPQPPQLFKRGQAGERPRETPPAGQRAAA